MTAGIFIAVIAIIIVSGAASEKCRALTNRFIAWMRWK